MIWWAEHRCEQGKVVGETSGPDGAFELWIKALLLAEDEDADGSGASSGWLANFTRAPAARARQQHARFVRLRLLFMVASGAIAVAVPKFGSLLALCGSLGNSLSIYILPHVCYLRASRTRTLADTAGTCAVIGCGVVACVIGTTASLADLAAGG